MTVRRVLWVAAVIGVVDVVLVVRFLLTPLDQLARKKSRRSLEEA